MSQTERRHRTRQSAEYYASLLREPVRDPLSDLRNGVNAKQARDLGEVLDWIGGKQ